MALTHREIADAIAGQADTDGAVDYDKAADDVLELVRQHLEMQPYCDDLYDVDGNPVEFRVDRDYDLMWTA